MGLWRKGAEGMTWKVKGEKILLRTGAEFTVVGFRWAY